MELTFENTEESLLRISTDSVKRTLTLEAIFNYVESLDPIVITEDELINELGLQFAKRKYIKTLRVEGIEEQEPKPKKERFKGHLLRHAGSARAEVDREIKNG
jgi:hypothetical protein